MPNKVQWTEVRENAFNDLKRELMSYSVLQNLDFTCNFVSSDLCNRGLGDVLLQLKGKCRHPIILSVQYTTM